MKISDHVQSARVNNNSEKHFEIALDSQNVFIGKNIPRNSVAKVPSDTSSPRKSLAAERSLAGSPSSSSSLSAVSGTEFELYSKVMTRAEAEKILEKDAPVKPAMADLFPKPDRAKQKRWLPVTFAKTKVHAHRETQFQKDLSEYNQALKTVGKSIIPTDIFQPGIPVNKDRYRSVENLALPTQKASVESPVSVPLEPQLTRRNSALSTSSSENDDLAQEMRRLGV